MGRNKTPTSPGRQSPSRAASSIFHSPEAIFLDVDGVLIDSVGIKGVVLVEVFNDFPDSAERVLEFHRAHGGLTREIKVRQILQLLGNESPTESEVFDRVSHFTELVVERVIQAPEMPGTRTFLQEWSNRCPLHAVSATPDEELQRIMVARDLLSFFQRVSGWPPEKSESISQEIASGGFDPSQCILVGDSGEDYQAAMRASVHFIFFGAPTTGGQQASVPRITSWSAFGEAAAAVLDQTVS